METISNSNGIRGSVESLIGGRQENQDSYGMAETRIGMLVCVCDGMGGGPAGKTASTIATQSIIDFVSGAQADRDISSILEDATVAANEAILAEVARRPDLKGMGTTCVCVLITKSVAYVVHVGDSRCYLLRANKVVFRTSDHSYVGELVKRGTMTEEQARTSKYSNVITRAIGAGPDIVPEVDVVPFKPGDRFALMSDGIWGTMPEEKLVTILSEKDDPASLVPEIAAHVDAIGKNNGGGHDNLTLAIVEIPGQKLTINDRFRKTDITSKGSSSDYVLEDIQNTQIKEQENKKNTPLMWILVSALFICVIIIAYLLIWAGGEEKIVENGRTDVNVIDSRTNGANSGNADSNQTIDEINSIVNSRNAEEQKNQAKDESSRQQKKSSNPESQNNSNSKQVNPNNTEEISIKRENLKQINDIINKLAYLRDYDPDDISRKDTKARKKKRNEMMDEIIRLTESLRDNSKNQNTKESIGNICKEINSKKKRMTNISDGQTQKEGREIIDNIITELEQLTK